MAKKNAKKVTVKKTGAKRASPKRAKRPSSRPEVLEQAGIDPEIVESGEIASTAITTTDPLSRYLQEIRRYPLLTREEEKRLALLYREKGDPKAAEILVTSNLRFVVKVAAEYTRFGAKLIDLIQEGNVGLMHAVREFNPYKDVRLITYAVWWIRGYIQEYLMRQYSLVRIGTTPTQRKLFYQLQRQKEELDRMGPAAAVAQISGRLGVAPEEVRNMQQRLGSRDVSLDKPVSDSQEETFINLQAAAEEISTDDQLGNMQQLHLLRDQIEGLRPDLNEREQMVLDERLLAEDPLTLQEIGEKYQITREAVRQIEQRLIEKLRLRLNDRL